MKGAGLLPLLRANISLLVSCSLFVSSFHPFRCWYKLWLPADIFCTYPTPSVLREHLFDPLSPTPSLSDILAILDRHPRQHTFRISEDLMTCWLLPHTPPYLSHCLHACRMNAVFGIVKDLLRHTDRFSALLGLYFAPWSDITMGQFMALRWNFMHLSSFGARPLHYSRQHIHSPTSSPVLSDYATLGRAWISVREARRTRPRIPTHASRHGGSWQAPGSLTTCSATWSDFRRWHGCTSLPRSPEPCRSTACTTGHITPSSAPSGCGDVLSLPPRPMIGNPSTRRTARSLSSTAVGDGVRRLNARTYTVRMRTP
ncbi:hypothetical protein L227DRAFT_427266 [Lentinus tigrinus ALCF2SS1-6]|uniref:Uncharacterized protein n=1 Tax=Lentinus tigrinus ALCF2SS1-6 TaxID=1328759 RepID=A0A5C2RP29_9APHY|nr:hypothetical protein L227DRAFT_427266 [Lentinus tigrinus ALCF2SS1-6]